jgi:hypothetical protein
MDMNIQWDYGEEIEFNNMSRHGDIMGEYGGGDIDEE